MSGKPSRIQFARNVILGTLHWFNGDWLNTDTIWQEVVDHGYVSRDTVYRALRALVQEGLVEREPRRNSRDKDTYVFRCYNPDKPYRAYVRQPPRVDIDSLSYQRGTEGADSDW